MRNWSPQQIAIFKWFEKDQNFFDQEGIDINVEEHLVARARAGTGKSTTIREGAKRAPEKSILIAAFSKDIQLEMQRLIAPFYNGKVQTLHSVGFACVNVFREKIKVDFSSTRADALALAVCGRNVPDAIVRLVSKLHTKGREIAPHSKNPGDLIDIAITFDCEPDAVHAAMGFDVNRIEEYALQAMELASDIKSGDTIDGSDMIFLPVRNGWLTPQFDLVVVDEAQDMTTAQLEVAQGVMKPNGRMCIVGDNRQAIFGFRGADSNSLDRLKSELEAGELGLTTTYRCGQKIVELAQEFVPDFEAGPDNPEGEILELSEEKLKDTINAGDMFLSRVNAPLVGVAMKLLQSGKRTRIAGRDIGKGLIALIRKMRANSVPDFLRKVENWANRERTRLEGQLAQANEGRKNTIKSKIESVMDQADMLTSLAEGAKNVEAITIKITELFTDDGLGDASVITCSSIHRAKGKEANRVFILRNTLRNYNIEEENLQYVAITRAKNTLVWVG